ncbi:MAG: zinc ribbon domain-containing protein [Schaedlerella sp.]|nr:zinc ribbon domain-containing protein [Schaedlerella sp.]
MYCENCGKRIADDSIFCEYCGTKIEMQLEQKSIECPYCHGFNKSDSAFCEYCGNDLVFKEEKKSSTKKSVILIIGIATVMILLVSAGFLMVTTFGIFSEDTTISEEIDENERNKSDKTDEAGIDIDGTKTGETIAGTFVYTGNREGRIELKKESNVYTENEDGEEELIKSVETVYIFVDQISDMVESQWNACSGHEASVEGNIYIEDGDVYVQASGFEITEDGYYDITEGGINDYTFHVDNCTWLEAQEKADALGGVLVHINCEEEYEYILSEIESRGYNKIQFKIGGRRDIGSQEYYWVDENDNLYGEVINSSTYWCENEWMEGEPSYKDGSIEEPYLQIFYRQSENRWCINDIPNDIISIVPSYKGYTGYIVEYTE